MTATINKDGVLIVKAETGLESYALMLWGQENNIECKGLLIDGSLSTLISAIEE
ncbi:MAG: hypothetical protein JRJ00_00180 [Deltaproteobacteria bacterium]|nr:hypothetical protein [Deltaproteobacteria bacterium]